MTAPATSKKLQLKMSPDDLKKAASRIFKGAGVPQSFEFDRIEALPRRVWQATDTEGMTPEGLAELLTNALKRPGGKIKLWPRQARVLQELHDFQGSLALLKVGSGKTIPSFLAPSVVDAKRALLLVPAKLREKTKRDFAELSRHFYGKPPMVVSYEKLSREGGTEFLHDLNPDLLVLDECFVGSTLVTTPCGTKRIDELKIGDNVVAHDGSIQRVEDAWESVPSDLMEVCAAGAKLYCTPNHPFLTVRGWRAAGDLDENDELVCGVWGSDTEKAADLLLCGLLPHAQETNEQNAGLRGVRNPRASQRQGVLHTEVPRRAQRDQATEPAFVQALWHEGVCSAQHLLFSQLHGFVDNVSAWFRQPRKESESVDQDIAKPEDNVRAESAICAGQFTENDKSQSYAEFGSSSEGVAGTQGLGSRSACSRRERQRPDQAAGVTCGTVGMADGACSCDRAGQTRGGADSLQDRHRGTCTESSCRGGRGVTRFSDAQGSGREERRFFTRPRVARVEGVKRRSPARPGYNGKVYNLQVSGPHTYLVDGGIVVHNCHRIANKQAAVTRRVRDWMKHHPDTALLAMSGTITKRSLHNFAHVLEWTLGKRRMPLPSSQRDLDDWARAVDVDEKGSFKGRMPPGALVTLFNQEERDLAQTDLLKATRHTVKRRLHETSGVIASEDNDDDVAASLNIEVRPVERYGPRIEKLFEDMNNDILPNGDPVTDATLGVRWGKCRELTSGFWYDWDPRPPDEWLLPRRAWKKLAAAVLDRHLQGLESEGAVAANLQRFGVRGLQKFGVGQDLAAECAEARAAWDKVKDTFKPNIVPRWESDRMIEEIAKWTKHHKGLIWISEVALGERLEKEGIVPYYGRMGLDSKGRFVEDAKRKDGSIALSVGSNSEGRNLQHEWDEALVVSCPPTGTVHEQMYGRLHRPGQTADEVWFEILIGCGVEYACWIQALKDAHYAVLDGRKKLTYCSKTVENMPWGSNALWPLSKKTQ